MNCTLPRTADGKFVPGHVYSPETLFSPGQEPINKGKKFPGTGNLKSFKKGNLPHNTLHDHDITIRTNNQGRSYQYIRTELGKWEFLQRWKWTEEVGPIPAKMILRCKTEDTMNCDPQNWMLITKGQNAFLNRFRCAEKTNVCKICNTSYQTRSKKSKYCSDECRRQGNLKLMHAWHLAHPKEKKEGKRNITTKVKICVICESAFFPTSNIQKTCSESCQTIRRELIRKGYKLAHQAVKSPVEKHCSKCGIKFETLTHSRTICDGCRSKKPAQCKCIQCGNEFTRSNTAAQLLCSDQCKTDRRNWLRANYGLKRKPSVETVLMLVCPICSNEFESVKGFKFCSKECSLEQKRLNSKNFREKKRMLRAVKQKPVVFANCRICGNEFEKKHKTLFCSDECRLELKRKKAVKHRSKPVKAPEPVKLNRRNPKQEKEAVENMLELNRNAPKHDREKLKHVKSPDIRKMQFRYVDKRMRCTYYFFSEEKYLLHLKKLTETEPAK